MLGRVSFTSADEQRALQETVAELMAKRSSETQVRELMATDTGFDPDVWRDMAQMGLLGLLIPEEYGGSGAGHVEVGVVMEEVGRALLCGPFLSTAVLATNLLAVSGNAAEQRDVLPQIANGSLVVGLAYAEAGSARPPATPQTVATRRRGGYRVTGTKTFVLDALTADMFYVLADSDAGPTIFTMDRDAPGLTVETLTTVDETRKQGAVTFADTPARRIGTAGDGVEAVNAALDRTAVALLSEQAGGAQRVMEMAADYAKTRYQFGRAIGSFQAVKHMCADMLLEAESAMSAARFVAEAFDRQAPIRLADLALAQAYCAEAYLFVAATNIQIHGGIGFTWEHPAHLYLRRARSDAQLFGEPAWHRERYLQQIGA
jgi:alkylation response protein AidB-like acyl-CoA dehydrogenase